MFVEWNHKMFTLLLFFRSKREQCFFKIFNITYNILFRKIKNEWIRAHDISVISVYSIVGGLVPTSYYKLFWFLGIFGDFWRFFLCFYLCWYFCILNAFLYFIYKYTHLEQIYHSNCVLHVDWDEIAFNTVKCKELYEYKSTARN